MATGPQHYHEAERLLSAAARGTDDTGLIDRQRALRAAAVHAQLATAAAIALNTPGGEDGGMYVPDATEWERAASACVDDPEEER